MPPLPTLRQLFIHFLSALLAININVALCLLSPATFRDPTTLGFLVRIAVGGSPVAFYMFAANERAVNPICNILVTLATPVLGVLVYDLVVEAARV